MSVLQSRMKPLEGGPEGILPTTLCTHRADAEQINKIENDKINEIAFNYTSEDGATTKEVENRLDSQLKHFMVCGYVWFDYGYVGMRL